MAATDLLVLADARKAIRIPTGDTSRDTDLTADYIPAVTPIVEDVIGPVVRRAFTYNDMGGRDAYALPHVGIVAVSGVQVAGVTSPAGDYFVNLPSGIITRKAGVFGTILDTFTATYTAGMVSDTASVPADIRLASRLILAWLWQRDQNGMRPDAGSAADVTVKTPSGIDIPRSALSILGINTQNLAPGFA